MKKSLSARFLTLSGLRQFLGRVLPYKGVLVLNYHRVTDGIEPGFDAGLWSADPDSFRNQIRFCKSHLEMITPDDLTRVAALGRGRYGMITFDDGYRDNYEVAFSILKAEGVPATFFVSTGFVDDPRVPWWDDISWMVQTSQKNRLELPEWLLAPVPCEEREREAATRTLLRAYKALPVEAYDGYLCAIADATQTGRCPASMGDRLWMTWDMLREMRAAGMVVGGHTVTHPVLARGDSEGQRDEIFGCAARLAEELGEPVRHFSYPVGRQWAFNSETRECLRQANVEWAFSNFGGVNRFNRWDQYDMRRVGIERFFTADWFKAIVSLPRFFA
jgi:peptidoglycan/xylan/chitin deacetylase (PgdA/CDA1 family)